MDDNMPLRKYMDIGVWKYWSLAISVGVLVDVHHRILACSIKSFSSKGP